MKTPGVEQIYPVTTPRVAGKSRNEPPATVEEARLRATGKTIYRLHKDTRRAYWWVNAIVTNKMQLRLDTSAVRGEVRRKIEEYEKEAGIDVQPWPEQ